MCVDTDPDLRAGGAGSIRLERLQHVTERSSALRRFSSSTVDFTLLVVVGKVSELQKITGNTSRNKQAIRPSLRLGA